MLSKIMAGAVYGIDAFLVEIEVNAGRGQPKLVVVGLPDAAVKESGDRVFTAMINSGFCPPSGHTTINLAPADVKKEGPRFDLPIALGMIGAIGEIEDAAFDDLCVIGELALSGEVRSVRGVLPVALRARQEGITRMIVPEGNADEAGVVDGLTVYPVKTLREAADFLSDLVQVDRVEINKQKLFEECSLYEEDFADVKAQGYAKRAFEVAVAGGHNLLAIGPPGTGKTMLAKRVRSILPPMSLDEALETTKIHSIAGTLPARKALVATRPYRSPHHTISDAGLLGGGSHPMPGEVSLAHHGVLFLDELPEFHRNVLEVMRQPLEDGMVTISRAAMSVTFPCRFMLVAAMNPCPCGFLGDPKKECRCSPIQIQRYRSKISGPLLDRIDIHVEVPAVQYKDLASSEKGEPSSVIRERIVAARQIQLLRFADSKRVHCNAAMGAKEIEKYCKLDEGAEALLKMAISDLNFSARAYNRILKVARTIADLAESEQIGEAHISEAIQYRSLDRQLW